MRADREMLDFTSQDPWRVFRILAEFVDSFEELSTLGPAISVFGSARTPYTDPCYAAAQEMGGLLARNGYGVITGGGPGTMEAANKGAFEAGGVSVGLKADTIREALSNDQFELRVEAEMKLGASLGVQGTPTSFVNGIPVYGAQTDGWEEIIDAQLELAKPLADQGLKGEELYKAIVDLNIAE